MLKVVGASWDQIRLSWWLLGGVAMLGLVAVYCGGRPRAAADGNYAATVLWNSGVGFRCEYFGQNNHPNSVKKGVARAYYQSEIANTGFAVLEIETQGEYPDFVQAYAAGYLEGSLTWQLIYYHWQNTVQKTCLGRQEYCIKIKNALSENTDSIRQKAIRYHKTDSYWHQIKLFYDQLDGLMYGWMAGVRRSRRNMEALTLIDFLMINVASDLRDLEKKYNGSRDFNPSKPNLSLAIVKLLPDNISKFVLGHTSSGSYSAMLRVQKKYTFGYHKTGTIGSNFTPGQVLMFTSYPGSIHSQDDLYLIQNEKEEKSVVVGTAIQNYNPKLWDLIDLSAQILMGPRILAANRLASDGETWSKIAIRENSGSGNKQWLHLKSNQVSMNLWVTEMMPGISIFKNETKNFHEKGYWISSNVPYFPEIISISKSSNSSEKSRTSHNLSENSLNISLINHNPAVNTLVEGQGNIVDVESLRSLMRSPDLSIVGRSDLLGVQDPLLFYNLPSNFEPAKDLYDLNNSTKTVSESQNLKETLESHVMYVSKSLQSNEIIPDKSDSDNSMEFLNAQGSVDVLRNKEDLFDKPPEEPKKIEPGPVSDPEARISAKSSKRLEKIDDIDESESISISNDDDDVRDNGQFSPVKSYEPDSSVRIPDRFLFASRADFADQYNAESRVDYNGLIDIKILTDDFDLMLAAGPPFNVAGSGKKIEPFQWSKSPIKNIPHVGHVDVWNYDFIQSQWVW